METINKGQSVVFQLRGKKCAVDVECNKNLESLSYSDAESNMIIGRLRNLIDAVLATCSDNLAVEIIVQIPGVVEEGVLGTDGRSCQFKHLELIIKPLWGYCE